MPRFLITTALRVSAAVVVGIGFSLSASAAAVDCSYAPTGVTDPANTYDFRYNGSFAKECRYDNGQTGPGGNATAKILTDNSFFGITPWAHLATYNDGTGSKENKTLTFGASSLTFSIDYLSETTVDGQMRRNYQLKATPADSELLPMDLDLMGVIKQSTGFVAFLFQPAVINASNDGYFVSDFWLNRRGKPVDDFSNVRFFGANFKPSCVGEDCDPDDPGQIPAPGTLALVGLGLLGAAWARRRRT